MADFKNSGYGASSKPVIASNPRTVTGSRPAYSNPYGSPSFSGNKPLRTPPSKKPQKSGISFDDIVVCVVSIAIAALVLFGLYKIFFAGGNNYTPVSQNEIGFGFYYNQLNDTEKEIYRELYKNASKGKITCFSNHGKGGSPNKAANAMINDHAELFRIQYYSSFPYGQNSSLFRFVSYESFDGLASYSDRFEKDLEIEVRNIVNQANQYQTDYEKAKFVHDYLVLNTSYATTELFQYENSLNGKKYDYIYSAYGCLVNKRCVCAGYARAYQLLLSELGIPCTYIHGEVVGRGRHAWNYVELGGQGYYTDVTWDDLDTGDNIRYDYYCISSDNMFKDRSPDGAYFSYQYCPYNLYQ